MLETCWWIIVKLILYISCVLALLLLDIYPREMTSYAHVHNCFTHHSLSLETTQPFTRRRKGKVNALYKPLDYSPPGSSVHEFIQERQEYWSGLTFPPPVDLSNSEIQPMSTGSPAQADFFSPILFIFFYWRIIALQNFVVFCQTSARISPRYTHVPSLPSPSPSLPSRLSQSPCVSFLSHTANSHWLSILHMVM